MAHPILIGMNGVSLIFVLTCVAIIGGCQNQPSRDKKYLKPISTSENATALLFHDTQRSFDGYLKLNCNFYDKSGNLILEFSNSFCHLMTDRGLIFWASPQNIGVSSLNKVELWSKPINGHHDFYVDEDGEVGLAVVRRKSSRQSLSKPSFKQQSEVWHDGVEGYDISGNKVISWYSDDAFDQLSRISQDSKKNIEDTYYINPNGLPIGIKINSATIVKNHPFARYRPEFSDGNVLISLNRLGLLIIVNPKNGDIVWSYHFHQDSQLSGGAHHVRFLKNGNILLLENQALFKVGLSPLPQNTISQAVELDPLTKRRIWTYPTDDTHGFHNPDGSSAVRLENGNTLIAYDYAARILEIAPDGEIFWDLSVKKPDGSQNIDLMGATKISREHFERFLQKAQRRN